MPDGNGIQQQNILNYKTSEFYYYYNIWENYHFFGLPNGKGWLNEREWLINFLKNFEKAYRMYQSWRAKKENK